MARGPPEGLPVDVVRLRIVKPGQIDGAKVANAPGRQTLLTAGIGADQAGKIVAVGHPLRAFTEPYAGLGAGPGAADDGVPDLARLHRADVLHRPTGRLPGLQVAVPKLVVALDRRIREHQVPVGVGAHSRHQAVGNAHADVGVGDVTGLLLAFDEAEDVRVPVVENEHQRAASAAALFDEAGDETVERAPGNGAAGATVHTSHVTVARAQAGNVDPHTATAGHDFRHLRKGLHNAFARVFRRRHDVAVVPGQFLIRAGRGQDASGGNEFPVFQRLAEVSPPQFAQLGRGFRRGDAGSDPVHHVGRVRLQGFVNVFDVTLDDALVQQPHRDLRQVEFDDFADFPLAGLSVNDHDDRVPDSEGRPRDILQGVAIQKYLVAQLIEHAAPDVNRASDHELAPFFLMDPGPTACEGKGTRGSIVQPRQNSVTLPHPAGTTV